MPTFGFLDVSDDFPGEAHFAVATIDDKLFIHGGSPNEGGNPSNKLYKFYAGKNKWIVEDKNGPKLSNHDCFVENDRYINFVGGFDGKNRTSDVWTYDYRGGEWMKGDTKGFPEGGGLSSHTVSPMLRDGQAVVLGRIGGLRTHRKSSGLFKLLRNRGSNSWDYEEISANPASRSGHTATAISPKTIVVVGGRDEPGGCDEETVSPGVKLVVEEGFAEDDHGTGQDREARKRAGRKAPETFSRKDDRRSGSRPRRETSETDWRAMNDGSRMASRPSSRKYHVAVPDGDDGLLIYGGQSFSALRDPLSDMWQWRSNRWRSLKVSGPPLTGHKLAAIDGKVFILGGLTKRMALSTMIYRLENDFDPDADEDSDDSYYDYR